MFKIYYITNSVTDDFCVGLTKVFLEHGFKEHLGAATTKTTHLCNAICKYSATNFSISLIEDVTAPDPGRV